MEKDLDRVPVAVVDGGTESECLVASFGQLHVQLAPEHRDLELGRLILAQDMDQGAAGLGTERHLDRVGFGKVIRGLELGQEDNGGVEAVESSIGHALMAVGDGVARAATWTGVPIAILNLITSSAFESSRTEALEIVPSDLEPK